MTNLRIEAARSKPEEPLVAEGVDRAFIGGIVRDFYTRVRKDERLGPIFARHIADNWEPHLEKMTAFWCSVILKTGEYHGRPVPAHLKLKEVRETDFAIWLGLFRETVNERCARICCKLFGNSVRHKPPAKSGGA